MSKTGASLDNSAGRAIGPVSLASGKTGTLFAVVAALIVTTVSILQNKNVIDIAHSVVTASLVFWWLGWCTAFLANAYLRSAYERADEKACEPLQDGDRNSNEKVEGKPLTADNRAGAA